MNTLERICADKRSYIETCRQAVPLPVLEAKASKAAEPRGFRDAIVARAGSGRPALIGEIKKASPSVGLIRADFRPAELAETYEDAGAACLSILTDIPWFQGRDEDLQSARNACALPVLRKDFMLDPYQIVESRALGADCVLLIMAALSDTLARELYGLAGSYGMDVLLEVHDREEMERAIHLDAAMIGINSRSLKTLEVNLATAFELSEMLPGHVTRIAESGIKSNAEIARLQAAGFHGFLVGESLMRQPDLSLAVRALLGS